MTKVYVYETTNGDTVLIKADANSPGILELPSDGSRPETLLPIDLANAARELGYEVVHWRIINDFGAKVDGSYVRVSEDGIEEDDYLAVPRDIGMKVGEVAEKRLPSKKVRG